ncbi:MAG: 4Fe-4S dicluster domain-containing protein [Hyphomicrobiales bacterium]|nr:4Fe-4S dicluster domain-containing protein [Hyphomicrobiales bacterium]
MNVHPYVRCDEPSGPSASGLDRRATLRLFVSGTALALASCGRPSEQVTPYVEMPEGETPGLPMRFASALALGGYGRGVIVTSMEGRPIKIDGNPRHPASLGATDVFGEASLLSLYDPDRSKTPRSDSRIQPWSAFEAALRAQLERKKLRHGAGIALLTGRITSPTLVEKIDGLTKSLPEVKWYRYEPVDDDAVRAGSVQAFGRALTAIPRFGDVRVALMLDADPLGFGPEQIRFAHDLIGARRSHVAQDSLRLYAAEPAWTLTGAIADHRLAVSHQLVRNIALTIAGELGAAAPATELPPAVSEFVKAAADDLAARRGAALVQAGRSQPPEVHALCHWINHELRAPIDFIEPVDRVAMGHADALGALREDLDGRRIDTLFIIGANPAYDTPGDLQLAEAIGAVPFSVHLGLYEDETAARCTWHLPQSHPLESWSDIRAFDGTGSIVQPLIRPLYDSRTAHELLTLVGGSTTAGSGYDIVRNHWRKANNGNVDFDAWWRQSLQDGVIANSAAIPAPPPSPKLPQLTPARAGMNFTLALSPDPAVFDGSMANNAWLQECPKPFTKLVWGNALHMAEDDAHKLGVVDGDVVQLTHGRHVTEMPIITRPGQASGTLAATLGYGRSAAGSIGSNVGVDLYRLRPAGGAWVIENVDIVRTPRRENLLRTQHFFQLEGEAEELQPRLSLADLAQGHFAFTKPDANPPTLYPQTHYDAYEWAMTIDTSACIGCNACVIACQAENNVPIVGPDQIAVGRDMHWLRIDNYTVGGRPGFSPVPCMHCEHAPCEPVCPVAASVHDSEGLNVQMYNRCVGTRFCQSNCPYKVRRFNFFGYADGEEYKGFGADIVKAVFNPDVTVRGRGVMEKCTYCVQRISRARRTAEKEGRAIRDGEVVTACQAACPTQAISFGNLSEPQSSINAMRSEPHAYALLGNLGTRPRTTYLARLQNPNSNLGKPQS